MDDIEAISKHTKLEDIAKMSIDIRLLNLSLEKYLPKKAIHMVS